MGETKKAEDAAVEITELEKIEAERVDGVRNPANGTPILMMKALPEAGISAEEFARGKTLNESRTEMGLPRFELDEEAFGRLFAKAMENYKPNVVLSPGFAIKATGLSEEDRARAVAMVKAIGEDGELDETKDIAGGQEAIALIARLIGYECEELAAGHIGESYDISLLLGAVDCLKRWLCMERAGEAMADLVEDSAAAKADMSTASINDLPDSAFAYIEPGGEKDEGGKTTPRSKRHFPVHDAAHTRNALSRAPQSPFGEKAMPKIRAAARKFDIEVSASKSVAEASKSVDTVDAGRDEELLKSLVSAAVTEATKGLKEQLEAAQTELAKVKATPIPGGPVMSITQPSTAARDNDERTAKAEYYRAMAKTVTDPGAADSYRQLARQLEEQQD